MIKITNAPNLESISQKYLKKIQGKYSLQEGEQLISKYSFNGQEAHAGQVLQRKVLPNGNKKVRTVTVYAGNGPEVAIDSKIYSPSGELLKAYHGIRGAKTEILAKDGKQIKEIQPTRAYANKPQEVNQIIKDELRMNPDLKYNYAPDIKII